MIAPFHPIPSVKFEGRPNHQIYCHGKDHAAWMQYQYQRPATLVKSETWPKTLRCSILNDDPWHQFCKISSWCNESLAEQMVSIRATLTTCCATLSCRSHSVNRAARPRNPPQLTLTQNVVNFRARSPVSTVAIATCLRPSLIINEYVSKVLICPHLSFCQ